MANTVYNVEEVELQDGTLVKLRPSNIATLRKTQKILDKLVELGKQDASESEAMPDADEAVTLLVQMAAISLKSQVPAIANQEDAEELLDMDTIYKVIEVCMGVKLNDPKLTEAATEAMIQQIRDSKN